MIAINSTSGELYVSSVIDRENPLLMRTEGVLQIIVKVRVGLRLHPVQIAVWNQFPPTQPFTLCEMGNE